MRKVTATRHQNTQNAYAYWRTTPKVFFGTAARSSFGQLNRAERNCGKAGVLSVGVRKNNAQKVLFVSPSLAMSPLEKCR